MEKGTAVAPPAERAYKRQTMMPTPPPAAGRAIRFAALGLGLAAALLVLLIAAGAFDPRPLGPWAAGSQPGPLSLSGRGQTTLPQAAPFATPPARYSVHLSAAYVDGELDSGYGLTVGEGETLTVAVSPLGEAAVWTTATAGATPRALVPWQPWPHVRPGAASNEIWLDVDSDRQVTVWINRERLWQGELGAGGPLGGAALWLASFGGPVTVDFQALDWYGSP